MESGYQMGKRTFLMHAPRSAYDPKWTSSLFTRMSTTGPKDDLAARTRAKGRAANPYDTAKIGCAELLRINAAIAISR